MPSSSSRRRRTSCSTTCKALCACLALTACLALSVPSVRAQAGLPPRVDPLPQTDLSTQDSLPPEPAQVLLVYDAANAAMREEDVDHLSEMMTAMSRSLAFGDIRAFSDSLSQYEYVIAYRLEEIDPKEMEAVCAYEGNLLIMGSDFMKRYLRKTGQGALIEQESDFDRGVLSYAFSPEEAFSEIVLAENIARFASRDEGRGTVAMGEAQVPFFSKVANVRFTPVTSLSAGLARAALMQELTAWMWPYLDAPPDYGQYLVLDEIYPFMDAQALLDRVEALIGEGIPYVLSVMPVYNNASYPAMAQFCQILQYAQKNGGFIVLRAPIVQAPIEDEQELNAVLTKALRAYADNGVYTLGIEAPVGWTNDDFYLNILRRYRTVLVYDDGKGSGFSLDAGYNRLHYNHHQLIMPAIPLDGTGASHLTCYPSAVYLNAYETTPEEIHEMVSALKNWRVPFGNLWELDHSVWGDDDHLQYEHETLCRNGEQVQIVYEPAEYDDAYDYNRGIRSRITVSLQRENRLLTAVTAVVVVLFAIFMVYLRRVNRNSFFFDKE